jgi:hypothetical protein
MPTLDWIGKKAVLNHHKEVPYRLLKCDRELSFGDPDAGNLLVQDKLRCARTGLSGGRLRSKTQDRVIHPSLGSENIA